MQNKKCKVCSKEILPEYNATCSWECSMEVAKRVGGEIHQPNGLPIMCIKADGSMWEHEHADHPDYKFPVDVEFMGKKPVLVLEEGVTDEFDYCDQTHALIYTDGVIVVTKYECDYFMWWIAKNELIGGPKWYMDYSGWRLKKEFLNKIINLGNVSASSS